MYSSKKYFGGPTTCLALYESTSERCKEEEKLVKELLQNNQKLGQSMMAREKAVQVQYSTHLVYHQQEFLKFIDHIIEANFIWRFLVF